MWHDCACAPFTSSYLLAPTCISLRQRYFSAMNARTTKRLDIASNTTTIDDEETIDPFGNEEVGDDDDYA